MDTGQIFHLIDFLCQELIIGEKVLPANFFESLLSLVQTENRTLILNFIDALKKDRLTPGKMPHGMISYIFSFLSSEEMGQVMRCPPDYEAYMTTMYAHFGNKWISLHNGPMWTGTCSESTRENSVGRGRVDHDEMETDHSYSAGTESAAHEVELAGRDLLREAIDMTVGPLECSTSRSTLWAADSVSDRMEIDEGDLSIEHIERQHGLVKVNKHKPMQLKIIEAKCNIPGISGRSIRNKIKMSGHFGSNCTGTSVQMGMIHKAKQSNPSGKWIIKYDLTDVTPALRESVKHVWAGDVDIGDGEVQFLHMCYRDKIKAVGEINKGNRRDAAVVLSDLQNQRKLVLEDRPFLEKKYKEAKVKYNLKIEKKSTPPEEKMLAIAWDLQECEYLLELGLKISNSIENVCTAVRRGSERCIPSDITQVKTDLMLYWKGSFKKKRTAATHLLVFMISDEQRNTRPYALPVRCLAVSTLKDKKAKLLTEELIQAMTQEGMHVVGSVSDGEFNSLRTKGGRPISVIQLIMDSKEEARKINANQIEVFLKVQKGPDGKLQSERRHEAIPLDDLETLASLQDEGVLFEEAIFVLRRKHFPHMHNPYPWVAGKSETKSDCLKSLMATWIFRNKIEKFAREGIDFKSHLMAFEYDEETGELLHEREDHGHVLKRITACLRDGQIQDFDCTKLVEALHDKDTNLTYSALVGKNKQSVPDCERIFSKPMITFMEEKGYTNEANFLKLIFNWHRAADGRGLTEQQRRKYNQNFLNYILDSWIPWHAWPGYNYKDIDVNCPIKGICGLTRELVVALVCNLESKLQRSTDVSRPPEHPRAFTTDDVEAFFAMLRGLLGRTFDTKQFFEQYPKIIQEFFKKLDNEEKFHYYTGHCVYGISEQLPSFNEPAKSDRIEKLKGGRRGDPGIFVAGRATYIPRGGQSVRARFHHATEELPPVQFPVPDCLSD